MDQVKIRAVVSAHGLVKGQEVTVAETPTIQGAIRRGVFRELDRIPAPVAVEADTVTKVEDVDLPPEYDGPLPDPSDVFADDEEADIPETKRGRGKS